jgi:hypothetical protein
VDGRGGRESDFVFHTLIIARIGRKVKGVVTERNIRVTEPQATRSLASTPLTRMESYSS